MIQNNKRLITNTVIKPSFKVSKFSLLQKRILNKKKPFKSKILDKFGLENNFFTIFFSVKAFGGLSFLNSTPLDTPRITNFK